MRKVVVAKRAFPGPVGARKERRAHNTLNHPIIHKLNKVRICTGREGGEQHTPSLPEAC